MGATGQVILVVCVLVVWVAGLYRYEEGQARKDRLRATGPSRETSATGDPSLSN
jgi:hypothetical protein